MTRALTVVLHDVAPATWPAVEQLRRCVRSVAPVPVSAETSSRSFICSGGIFASAETRSSFGSLRRCSMSSAKYGAMFS